jgi:uncharacterized protein
MKCFYHSTDLDGICSGAIIKYVHPECKMFGINYGQVFPIDEIQKEETVYMVDFGLQPISELISLDTYIKNINGKFVWIDHHKSAIDDAKAQNFDPIGLRRVGDAACELVWEYMVNEKENRTIEISRTVPTGVKLLGRYDVWDLTFNENVSTFQYGMQSENAIVDSELWKLIFMNDHETIERLCNNGKVIQGFQKIKDAQYVGFYSFGTTLNGLRAIAVNRGNTGSTIFNSVWDEDKYDLMITFVKIPSGKWTVSLYSTKKHIDCGAIAKSFGGGGHVGAAGFQIDTLPFKMKGE